MAQKQEALQEQEKRSLTKNEWVAYVQTHLMTELHGAVHGDRGPGEGTDGHH